MNETQSSTLEAKIKSQITLRFREEEVQHIRENLHLFELPDDTRISDVFLKVFDTALNKNPKQSKTEDLKKIKELEQQLTEANEKIKEGKELQEQAEKSLEQFARLTEGTITIKNKTLKHDLWSITQIAKRDKILETEEEVIFLMLEVMKKNNFFILSEADKEYIKQIEHDITN